jgi:hypothetical protein
MAEMTREVARRAPELTATTARADRPSAPASRTPFPAGVSNAVIARLVASPGEGSPRVVRSAEGIELSFADLAQPKLRVSDPHEPAELEADAVSARVVRSSPSAETLPVSAAAQRQDAAGPSTAVPAVPDFVEAHVASPGPGEAIADDVRARIEPVLGADLGPVRVHRDSVSQAAAMALNARAFTVGADIFLGAGESADDLALMAHEATHVVQQRAVEIFRVGHPVRGPPVPTAMRKVPGADGMMGAAARDIARDVPGYMLLCQVVGEDLITGERVDAGAESLLEGLLSYGPFAGAFGPILKTLHVLDDIVGYVRSRLAAHDLTLSRLVSDIGAAWDEISLIEGVDYNVAIVEKYVDRILADVRAFVSDVTEDVLAAVRSAAADALQPLLDRPEVQPYWSLATKVFHYDPLRGVEVRAPTVEILADFLHLAGRDAVLAQMQERGTLQKTADWLDQQWGRFVGLLAQARQLFADAWDAISPSNLLELPTLLPQLADRAVGLIREVGAFVGEILVTVLRLVKDSLLGWLSAHAHEMRGFRLLTVILGRNPFTGETVERSAENLVRGFITLLPNGEATYNQLAESGVIADTAGRIDAEISRLGITWELITGTFKAVWDSLSLEDLLAPVPAFERVLRQLGEPLGRIFDFIVVVVQAVIELVLRLMGFPFELLGHMIDQAKSAINDIMNDPVAFLMHLIDALKLGLSNFFDHVAGHLLQGLAGWLFRGLRGLGIEPPASLSLQAVITLVIQVLGITAEALWAKLGEKIGADKVVVIRGALDRLGEAWSFLKDISERGITAVWEFIQGQLSNLWDMILSAARDWIMREIVEKVTAKLLSMLDPTGIMAVINSTIAFFKAIQSAIEYLTDILKIVDGWVSTVASIAKGAIAPGAQRLESGLADAIPIAIGFLANQVGLGDVPEKVREIIEGLRELFWEAVGWLLDRAIALGQQALQALGLGKEEQPPDAPSGSVPELTEEQREALYADVSQSVAGRSQAIEDDGAAKAMLSELLRQYAPRGLRGLEFQPVDPAKPGLLKVIASASPGKETGQVNVNMKLRISDILSKRGTSAMAWLNDRSLGIFRAETRDLENSDHSAHAENWLMLILTSEIATMHENEQNVLRVKLSRSPCPECFARLQQRQQQITEENHRPLRVEIETMSVHRGGTEAGVDQFVTMAMLQGDSLTLSAWHVLDELKDLGMTDEQIEKIRTPENIRWLEQRVAQVDRVLTAVATFRVGRSPAA